MIDAILDLYTDLLILALFALFDLIDWAVANPVTAVAVLVGVVTVELTINTLRFGLRGMALSYVCSFVGVLCFGRCPARLVWAREYAIERHHTTRTLPLFLAAVVALSPTRAQVRRIEPNIRPVS